MDLTVFKTNVTLPEQSLRLQSDIEQLPHVTQCNFDLEDCDRILRIISVKQQSQVICDYMQLQGFECEALESFLYEPAH